MPLSVPVETLVGSLPPVPVETATLLVVDAHEANGHIIPARILSPRTPAPTHVSIAVPPIALAGRPLEFDVFSHDLVDSLAPETLAILASVLRVSVQFAREDGMTREDFSCALLIQSAAGTLRIRPLVSPIRWAGASMLSIEALRVAGATVSATQLPARLRVGFNHGASGAGELWAAASAGDLHELEAALADGCSTEEANPVRLWVGRQPFLHGVPLRLSHRRRRRVALPFAKRPSMATSTRSARSWPPVRTSRREMRQGRGLACTQCCVTLPTLYRV